MSEEKRNGPRPGFPSSFWTANSIELLERAAYYSMASFMVIYLNETLGMRPTTATFLNGSILWGLIYFLPILSGTLADKFGFKRSLTVSFLMIALGYFVMGNLQRLWPALLGASAARAVDFTVPVVLGIVLIGIGGSVVKPCIAGTVQKTSGRRATLGFGIFYMVINIGSITGRGVSYFIRINLGIPAIFTYAASLFALIGLAVVLFLYKEPEYVSDGKKDDQKVQTRTLGQAIVGIFIVLSNLRFVFFLIVVGMFWVLYVQLYNLMPLFLRYVDPNAPMELYTLANPVMIVALQLVVTRIVKRWTPVTSIILGAGLTTAGMLLNVLPPLFLGDLSQKVTLAGMAVPVVGIFLIISIASMALGEMTASPRIYEYIGAIAPKGQEGLFLGYANLPIALASIFGGPLGGRLFEKFISEPQKAGQPVKPVTMWLIITGIGLLSMLGLAIYDRFLIKTGRSKDRTAPKPESG
jgi:POT family proton-dependent oligopeptide transporter